MFIIDKDKAPGPDGYGSGFFRASWSIIQQDVTRPIKGFFSSEKLLKHVNNTIVTLVPKVPCPNTVGDYRPIACCNTLIIASRLAMVLPDIISLNQGAFVKDRSIMKNIFICRDLARNYHRDGRTPRCMLKLDIRKAYDTLEWDFIRKVLLGLMCKINVLQTCKYKSY